MDLETLLVYLYVVVDEWWQRECIPLVSKPGRPPLLSDVEVLTLAILAQWPRWRSERDCFRFADTHLREYFPNLLSDSQLNRRIRGGEVKTQSEPGQGTKVRFELVLQRELEEAEKEQAVRILLVDDHATIRDALSSTFEGEEDFEVVEQAGSMAEARGMLDEMQQKIDVAVLDLGLPDGYGGDLIKEMHEKNPRAQALVLSATLDRAQIARAVERGAAGVLNKTAHLDEVVGAVRRLRAGETLMPLEEVVELLRFASTRRDEEYEARQAIESLTSREIEVLQALAEGLDSRQIADRLHISLRTERNHMTSILAKLGVHSQLQVLVLAQRHGVVEIR